MNPDTLLINDLAALRAVLDARQPVRPILWRGQQAFGKRCGALRTHERLLLSLAPLIRRWLARDLQFQSMRYQAGLPVEVLRLRALHAAGRAVPEVLAATHDVFVTGNAGRTLESALAGETDPEIRLEWLLEAARDLANFHQQGHWHGAAQIRNVVRMPDGRLGRIDFETALDQRFPLALLQAFDATLFFSSIVRSRDADKLPSIAQAYLAMAPEASRQALARAAPLLRALARSRLVRRLAPKEAERLQALAALPLA